MSKDSKNIIFDCYVKIIKEIYKTNQYECLLISDDQNILNRLIDEKIPFDYENQDSIKHHRNRVIFRNEPDWFELPPLN